ncbi:MAG: MFS transporter [Desulfobacterales bacterium]
MDAINKKKLEGNIWKFYLHNVLSGMFFAVPVMVLFWQENGLSLTEIMVLQSLFAIATVILEIPSGYFADIQGRKKTLVLAGSTLFVAMSVYCMGHGFFHFFIAEMIFAVSVSLTSGTTAALIYDTLENLKREDAYKKIWGTAQFWGMLALAVSNMMGGLIAKIDLRYALYASLPFFALLIPLTLSMQEPQRRKLIIEKGYTKELLNVIRVALLDNEKLRWIITYSGIIYAFNQSVLWLYQPYFKLTGLDIVYFGFVFATFQTVAALSSRYAYEIEDMLGQRVSLSMLIFMIAASYFLMSSFVFIFSFSFCFLQQFVRGFRNTVISDYINKLTPSSMRATILSTETFVGRLSYAAIIPLIGWIADVYTLVQALMVLAVSTLITGTVVLMILHKKEVI